MIRQAFISNGVAYHHGIVQPGQPLADFEVVDLGRLADVDLNAYDLIVVPRSADGESLRARRYQFVPCDYHMTCYRCSAPTNGDKGNRNQEETTPYTQWLASGNATSSNPRRRYSFSGSASFPMFVGVPVSWRATGHTTIARARTTR